MAPHRSLDQFVLVLCNVFNVIMASIYCPHAVDESYVISSMLWHCWLEIGKNLSYKNTASAICKGFIGAVGGPLAGLGRKCQFKQLCIWWDLCFVWQESLLKLCLSCCHRPVEHLLWISWYATFLNITTLFVLCLLLLYYIYNVISTQQWFYIDDDEVVVLMLVMMRIPMLWLNVFFLVLSVR